MALMDALVFFVAAMTVSAILISLAPSDDQSPHLPKSGTSDPSVILNFFLESSVGERVAIELEKQVFVDDSDDAALCLVLEASALKAGAPLEAFCQLNALLERMLRSLTSPLFRPCLSLIDPYDTAGGALLSLMSVPENSDLAYASSCNLSLEDGTKCLAVLVLSPTSSPEKVDV